MRLERYTAGKVSLEFEPGEEAEVLARLATVVEQAGLGSIQRRPQVTMDLIVAGDIEFVLGTEPGEECLLSGDPRGQRLLRAMVPGRVRAGDRGAARAA